MLLNVSPAEPVTLARLETRWQTPWLVAGLSHWGLGHAEEGLPNQDAFAFGSVGRTTWLAVADGVSAAPLAGDGAAFAVAAVGQEIATRLKAGAVDAKHLERAVISTRRRLSMQANLRRYPVQHFATTLLVAVISERDIVAAKIGDGYVLGIEKHRSGSAIVPIAESALRRQGSEVIDLTHDAWRDQLAIRHIPDRAAAGIATVALATDGCSRFFHKAVDPGGDGRTVALNPDLIDGHLHANLERLGARNFFVYLANLMGHRQFVDEGDDRTLLVATLDAGKGIPCSTSTA